MEWNDIPDDRLLIYARAAADEGQIETQQRTADQALQDVTSLLEAGEVELAGGAVTVALRAILLRSAAPAGSEGVAAARDLDIKRAVATALDDLIPDPRDWTGVDGARDAPRQSRGSRMNVPLAAIMVRAAVAHEAALLAERDASPSREERP